MQKIFVIEDDENIRNLVKIALEGYGYQVLAFETAEEALELVGERTAGSCRFRFDASGYGRALCYPAYQEQG